MRIDIITLHPELLDGPFSASILKRAIDKKLVQIVVHQLRDYSKDKHKRVDDTQFGGGAGMVMSVLPISSIIDRLKSERSYDEIIYMSPDGLRFNQSHANQLSSCNNIILLCGHLIFELLDLFLGHTSPVVKVIFLVMIESTLKCHDTSVFLRPFYNFCHRGVKRSKGFDLGSIFVAN